MLTATEPFRRASGHNRFATTEGSGEAAGSGHHVSALRRTWLADWAPENAEIM